MLVERAEIAQEALRHMDKSLAQSRIRRAPQHQTPPATDLIYNPGDKVLVWREKVVENRIGELVGPYILVSVDAQAKIVLVQKDADSKHGRYNIVRIRTFLLREAAATGYLETLHASL